MSIKNYDKHLFYHSVNVTIIALLIGLKLSLSEEQMKIVGLSGLLHDVGKLKIPHEIISKSGPLTESEWEMVRRHPIEGANLLMRYESVPDLAILTSLEHHVGYDLSGYPSVRDKDRPHLFIRIIGVADAYEAMTANRSYRSAQTMDRAIKVLLDCSGSQFDPLLVKALLNIVGIFPPGSLVRLKNGASAVVAEPNEDNPFYPKVRAAEDFSRISADTPLINTADDPSQYAIVSVADSPDI
jgi:HD-GYP domain-containing protein (c-di-GMP phosphodiesterase class II)